MLKIQTLNINIGERKKQYSELGGCHGLPGVTSSTGGQIAPEASQMRECGRFKSRHRLITRGLGCWLQPLLAMGAPSSGNITHRAQS